MTLMMFECFLAAMSTLNFTTAAQNIHITQPAFSRNIAALEEEIGFKLFVRSKQNGLRVTPAGLELYNGILKLEKEFELLKDRAARINRGEEGELVIATLSGSCMDSVTMGTIRKFQETYPRVRIQLHSHPFRKLIESVEQGESDICFMLNSAVKERKNLLYEDVFMVENYLVVPSTLHCDSDTVYSLKDFENEYFILSEDAAEFNELLEEACRRAGFEPKTKMAPDFETKMLWAEFGEGLAINSREHYIKNSAFVDFVKVKEILSEGYAMVWQKDNYNPAIALFYSMFGEIMSS